MLDGTILQDNSTVFFCFLEHFIVALMVFIFWRADKERHSARKTPTVSLILCEIFLHLFGYCWQLCEGSRFKSFIITYTALQRKMALFKLQYKKSEQSDQTRCIVLFKCELKSGFEKNMFHLPDTH